MVPATHLLKQTADAAADPERAFELVQKGINSLSPLSSRQFGASLAVLVHLLEIAACAFHGNRANERLRFQGGYAGTQDFVPFCGEQVDLVYRILTNICEIGAEQLPGCFFRTDDVA